jgi:hypothetical protein
MCSGWFLWVLDRRGGRIRARWSLVSAEVACGAALSGAFCEGMDRVRGHASIACAIAVRGRWIAISVMKLK